MTERFRKGSGAFFSSESLRPPFGAVFEEEGGVAYLYACDLTESTSQILDAVLVYQVDTSAIAIRDSEARIMWTSDGLKAGLFLDERLEATIDFENRTASSRTNYPPPSGPWSGRSRPSWSESFSELFWSPHVG